MHSRFDENLHVGGLVYANEAILEKLKKRKRIDRDRSAAGVLQDFVRRF